MTRRQKLIRMIPFFILCAVMLYTWFQFLFGEYISKWYNITALLLVLMNVVAYWLRFKTGLIMTGIVLLLGITHAVCFFTAMSESWVRIAGFTTPAIQSTGFLLLLIYCFFNIGLLLHWYLDWKEGVRNDQ